MPEDLLMQVPYKITFEALKTKDQEKLNQMMKSTLAKQIVRRLYDSFNTLDLVKREKKNLIRASVYLDALI